MKIYLKTYGFLFVGIVVDNSMEDDEPMEDRNDENDADELNNDMEGKEEDYELEEDDPEDDVTSQADAKPFWFRRRLGR